MTVTVLPCGAEGESIVFVTLSPVVCCAIADGTLAKSTTPNTSARERNKLADFSFRVKGAIPVLVTVRTPGRHGQDLSIVISLLLLGWAEPRRWNGWLWERDDGLALCFLIYSKSLRRRKSSISVKAKNSSELGLQLQPARPNNPFSLDCSVFVGGDRLRSQLKVDLRLHPIGLS